MSRENELWKTKGQKKAKGHEVGLATSDEECLSLQEEVIEKIKISKTSWKWNEGLTNNEIIQNIRKTEMRICLKV